MAVSTVSRGPFWHMSGTITEVLDELIDKKIPREHVHAMYFDTVTSKHCVLVFK